MGKKDKKTKSAKNKIDLVLEEYRNGRMTIGRAAEIAKKDLREMMQIADERGIPFQYSLQDLREDIEAAKKSK